MEKSCPVLQSIQLRIMRGYSDGLSINIYTYGALPSQLQGRKAENA
jgi:hypothetical protein